MTSWTSQHGVHIAAHVATMCNPTLFMKLVVHAQAVIALGALRIAPPDVLVVHALAVIALAGISWVVAWAPDPYRLCSLAGISRVVNLQHLDSWTSQPVSLSLAKAAWAPYPYYLYSFVGISTLRLVSILVRASSSLAQGASAFLSFLVDTSVLVHIAP